MEQQWAAQESLGVARSGEIDGIRQLLIDTDPKLIVLTVIVSLLHTLFNFLAFSNDVKFYNQIKDFSGLSLRSMVSLSNYLSLFPHSLISLSMPTSITSSLVWLHPTLYLSIYLFKGVKLFLPYCYFALLVRQRHFMVSEELFHHRTCHRVLEDSQIGEYGSSQNQLRPQ